MSAQNSAASFITNEFCEALSVVFEQTTGAPYVLQSTETTNTQETAETLDFVFAFSGKITGQLKVEVDKKSAAMLASKFIGEDTGDSVDYLPEHDDAVLEILSQSAGVIANTWRTRFGTADVAAEHTTDSHHDSSIGFTLASTDSGDSIRLKLYVETTLVDCASRVLAEEISAQASAAATATREASTSSLGSSAQEQVEQHKLRLIMDVELSLTLRFGQRILPLSEVADLTSGSVIELDRQVDEPVELLLGDRVIARGEVVIVDGNYGLRITEMASVADRASLLSA